MASYSAQSVVQGRAFLKTLISALGTVPGGPLLASAKLRLSKDINFNPNRDSLVADLASGEADYAGYTAGGVAVTPSAPVNIGAIGVGMVTDNVFHCTGSTTTNTIYGWWIDDGVNLVAAERFAGSFAPAMAANGDYLDLLAVIALQFAVAVAA